MISMVYKERKTPTEIADFFERLGVPINATEAEIKETYLANRACYESKPRTKRNRECIKSLDEAYRGLSTTAKRVSYILRYHPQTPKPIIGIVADPYGVIEAAEKRYVMEHGWSKSRKGIVKLRKEIAEFEQAFTSYLNSIEGLESCLSVFYDSIAKRIEKRERKRKP